MDHLSEDHLRSVSDWGHAVVRESKAASVWVFGCGIHGQRSSIVAIEGINSDGAFLETIAVIGRFPFIKVPTRVDTHFGCPTELSEALWTQSV